MEVMIVSEELIAADSCRELKISFFNSVSADVTAPPELFSSWGDKYLSKFKRRRDAFRDEDLLFKGIVHQSSPSGAVPSSVH